MVTCYDCIHSIKNNSTHTLCNASCDITRSKFVSIHEPVPIIQSRFYTPPCEEGMRVVQPNILTTEE